MKRRAGPASSPTRRRVRPALAAGREPSAERDLFRFAAGGFAPRTLGPRHASSTVIHLVPAQLRTVSGPSRSIARGRSIGPGLACALRDVLETPKGLCWPV